MNNPSTRDSFCNKRPTETHRNSVNSLLGSSRRRTRWVERQDALPPPPPTLARELVSGLKRQAYWETQKSNIVAKNKIISVNRAYLEKYTGDQGQFANFR